MQVVFLWATSFQKAIKPESVRCSCRPSPRGLAQGWWFRIGSGDTFTDVVACPPMGPLHVRKVLSGARAA